MTTIQYRENFSNGYIPSEIMDDRTFDLFHFSEACGQSPEWVMQLIEHGILPNRSKTHPGTFLGKILLEHNGLTVCSVILMLPLVPLP